MGRGEGQRNNWKGCPKTRVEGDQIWVMLRTERIRKGWKWGDLFVWVPWDFVFVGLLRMSREENQIQKLAWNQGENSADMDGQMIISVWGFYLGVLTGYQSEMPTDLRTRSPELWESQPGQQPRVSWTIKARKPKKTRERAEWKQGGTKDGRKVLDTKARAFLPHRRSSSARKFPGFAHLPRASRQETTTNPYTLLQEHWKWLIKSYLFLTTNLQGNIMMFALQKWKWKLKIRRNSEKFTKQHQTWGSNPHLNDSRQTCFLASSEICQWGDKFHVSDRSYILRTWNNSSMLDSFLY